MTFSVVPRSLASAIPCSSAARPNGSALYPTTIVMPRLLLAPVLASRGSLRFAPSDRISLRSSLVVVFGSCLRLFSLIRVVFDDQERLFAAVHQLEQQRHQQEYRH